MDTLISGSDVHSSSVLETKDSTTVQDINKSDKEGRSESQSNQEISTDNSKENTNSLSDHFMELSQEVHSSYNVSSFTPLPHLDQPRRSSRAKRGTPSN